MKVYELMNILEDAPAGMEVLISNRYSDSPSKEIHAVEVDGNDADSGLCLIIAEGGSEDE